MPTRVSTVGQAIERNQIASENPYIILLRIDVRDTQNQHVEYLYLARNTENVTYQSKADAAASIYEAANFEINVKEEAGEIPQVSVAANDVSGIVRSRMEGYRGGVGFKVRVTIINAGALDSPADIEEEFEVVSANAPAGFKVSFTLGAENPLAMRFPRHIQFRDRCLWTYKGQRCKYAGALGSCDYTLDGPNGCRTHDNVSNFGGAPSLRPLSYSG